GRGSGAVCLPEAAPACSTLTTEASCTRRDDCAWNGSSCTFPHWNQCRGFDPAELEAGLPSGAPGGTVDYDAGWLFVHEMMGHGVDGNLARQAGRAIYSAHPDYALLHPGVGNVTGDTYVGPPSY